MLQFISKTTAIPPVWTRAEDLDFHLQLTPLALTSIFAAALAFSEFATNTSSFSLQQRQVHDWKLYTKCTHKHILQHAS